LPTPEKVRATYASLSDFQLLKIANEEVDDLTDLGYQILQEELHKRNLYVREKIFQHEIPGENELDDFSDLIESLPCPGCGSSEKPLTGWITREVVSALVFTNSHECTIIGCEDCIEKWDRKNRRKTAIFGWWGLPWGISKTIKAINKNREADKDPQLESQKALDKFIVENIGYLRAFRHSKEKLLELLKVQNDRR
jgi:hypothetical protein